VVQGDAGRGRMANAESAAQILAVDDEESIRNSLTAGLTKAGYWCEVAPSADEAASVLDKQEFDLVLLDINMPGRSGVEFLPELKSRWPDVAVVMLSGQTDMASAVQTMRDGAYDYIVKPIGLADLIIRIEGALSRRILVIENRTYEQRQEEMIDQLNALLAQRKREIVRAEQPLPTPRSPDCERPYRIHPSRRVPGFLQRRARGAGLDGGGTSRERGVLGEYNVKRIRLLPPEEEAQP